LRDLLRELLRRRAVAICCAKTRDLIAILRAERHAAAQRGALASVRGRGCVALAMRIDASAGF
jgi:hypothetical protein